MKAQDYSNNRRIKDMLASERPQERLQKLGPKALSDRELIAMILRSGPPGVDVLSMSEALLVAAGSLPALLKWSPEDFMQVRGIGHVKALQLISVMEFAKRIMAESEIEAPHFEDADDVARHFATLVAGAEVERFWALCLNRKNRLIKRIEVTVGTATACLAHPREVFREAIRVSASAIIAVHNHPSGDPAPSSADIKVTNQLRKAADVVGIDLVDHVIVGNAAADPKKIGYYSFNEGGLI